MKILLSALLLLSGLSASSQDATSYTIDATYDAVTQSMQGRVRITIKNRTTQPLSKMYVNMYADAMVDKQSYFMQQQIDAGNLDLYFEGAKLTSAYKNVKVVQSQKELTLQRDFLIQEVAMIILSEAIQPGSSDTLSITYELQLQEKRVTQGFEDDGTAYFDLWYPTVARYADNAYVIEAYDGQAPATGMVQTTIKCKVESGHNVLLSGRAFEHLESDDNVVETTAITTQPVPLVITQRKLTTTPVPNSVDVISLANPDKGAVRLADMMQIVELMHDWLGAYPYPSLLVIQQHSDTKVITREGLVTLAPEQEPASLAYGVAKNYFDALFAPAESTQLKNGIASLYMQRYVTEDDVVLTDLDCKKCNIYELLTYYYEATQPLPMDVTPEQYRHRVDEQVIDYMMPLQLWAHVYSYTRASWDAAMMDLLAQSGRVSIDQWLGILQDRSGKPLDWVDVAIGGGKIDYSAKVKGNIVRISKQGKVVAPLPVTVERAGEDLQFWTAPLSDDTTIVVAGAQSVQLDANRITLDFTTDNNFSRQNDLPTVTLFRPGKEGKNQAALTVGYNLTDRVMAGVQLFSDNSLPSRWQYLIAPMWSFGSDDIVGRVHVRHNAKLTLDRLDRLVLGISGKHFHMDADYPASRSLPVIDRMGVPLIDPIYNGFYRVQPYMSLYFEGGNRTKALHLSTTYLIEQDVRYNNGADVLIANQVDRRSRFLSARYQNEGYGLLTDTDFNLELEFGDYQSAFFSQEQYLKVSAELRKAWAYSAKGHQFSIRFWGAAMLSNTASTFDANALSYKGVIALSHQNFNDYTFAEHHVDRLSNAAFLTRQVNYQRGGGFTHPTGLPSNALIGQSQRHAFSTNMVMDTPWSDGSNPLKLTFDFGGYSRNVLGGDPELRLLYSAGLRLDLGEVVLNMPVLYSDEFAMAYNGASFWRRISFSVNYPLLDKWTNRFEQIKR